MITSLRIAPSILSADFARLSEEVRSIESAGADLVHFGVMDDHYVPNLTIGPPICEAIHPHLGIGIDANLMVEPVDSLISPFAKASANIITFHPEATGHVNRTLKLIRDFGCKAGIVLNPATPLDWMDHVMERLDIVLLMSVNRGFGGQTFIAATIRNLKVARQRIYTFMAAGVKSVWLEVDRAVKKGNIRRIATVGADTCVAGSAVFGSPDADWDYRGVINTLREAARSV